MKTVVFSVADAASRRRRALWNALRPVSGRGAGVLSFFVALFISLPSDAPPKTFAFEGDGWRAVETTDAEENAAPLAFDENAEEPEYAEEAEYVEAETEDAYAETLDEEAEDEAETGPFHRLRSLRRNRTNRLFGGRFRTRRNTSRSNTSNRRP